MALLKISENPTIADTVLFELNTPDENGCYNANPYKINSVKIFYVERDFSSGNLSEFDGKKYPDDKLAAALAAEKIACDNPTEANIAEAKRLRTEAESSASTNPFFFNEARNIAVIGTPDYPAWLSVDENGDPLSSPYWVDPAVTLNNRVRNVPTDEEENVQYGRYTLEWEPKGMREGDYFLCWTWTPNPAGETLSNYLRFGLEGATQITTSIPTHFTPTNKYETLLERYLPEMFKMTIADTDKSPTVLDKFNKSVANGFTFLENLGNQIVDLLDANSTHEALLPYLSNMFDLKLKSHDPTLWRRQIKTAVPLFKQKGTLTGLQQAFDQAGMQLIGVTKLWQVVSDYTWQEAFLVEDSTSFELEKTIYSSDVSSGLLGEEVPGNIVLGGGSGIQNSALYIRPAGEDEWILLSPDYVSFSTSEGVTTMNWIGDELEENPLTLLEGDEIRILYQFAAIPNDTEQNIESYIRSLPLADMRDELDQIYPLKNWNVRVIAEDDPLFDVVIKTRHPYAEDLVWGQIRTEFPFSENIFNMEEYNGSLRNSKNPCDIDRTFKDNCTDCQASQYSIELEIQQLSNDRILEAQDILREYVPFRNLLYSMSFTGGVNEFVASPVEDVECLVKYTGQEFMIAGGAQAFFKRNMKKGYTNDAIKRNMLASTDVAVSTTSGTGYNDYIVVFCPEVKFDQLGMDKEGDAQMEILSPSPNAGIYTVTEPNGTEVTISGATEPLNTSAFTFRLSNEKLNGTLCNIFQDNIIKFSDSTKDFAALGVQSDWDVDQGTATGAWKLDIPAYGGVYTIHNVLPDGSLLVNYDASLPTSNASDVEYTLLTNSDVEIATGDEGALSVTARGRVVALDGSVQDVRKSTGVGDYMVIGSDQYRIEGYVPDEIDEFYIRAYNDGDAAGVNLKVWKRLTDNQIGYLSYRGMKLQTGVDYEVSLQINNGANPPVTAYEEDRFKESFLVAVDGDYYFITEIDGTTITLAGPNNYWETLGAGGTSVSFTIYRYTKDSFESDDGTEIPFIDRRGKEIITNSEQVGEIVNAMAVAMNAKGSDLMDMVSQNESISFQIEYADGSNQSGEL